MIPDLGTTEVVKLLLAVGWTAHALSWGHAVARLGRRAARRSEWPREAALRALIVGLLVAALLVPTGPGAPADLPSVAALVALFLGGQLLAMWGRRELGVAWGIGVTPTGSEPVVRSGPYRFLAHPIYLGTFLALLAQFLLLRSPPGLLLLGGAAIVIPWKIRAENRVLRRSS